MKMQIKFIQPNRELITPKQVTFSKLATPKLISCTTEIYKNNYNIKPLNIKEKDESSPSPTFQQVSNIMNDSYEYNSDKLQQIFNKFIVNVDNFDQLQCSNQIRSSIQFARINSQRLDELQLQITEQANSMDLLCSKQMSMIQNLQVYK
ncbi:Hypothetical_protein [Hexamita inflata]|uniref:Hypothetical_protein n=1 Tax=Hexamita inflata TaxID=28002 RepID=A0ABP1I356_9EUKA